MIRSFTFRVPISLEVHRIAQQLSQAQFTFEKAQKVYHNTLAVHAVDFYLRCMGLDTDFAQSDSHDKIMLAFTDVADLEVKNYGKLECLPVLSDAEVCYVPPDVWSDRIGYIVVHLNESLQQATIIGFAVTVAEKKGILPISELQTIADFPEYISQINLLELPTKNVEKTAVNLSNWLQNIFELDWQGLETLGIKSDGLAPILRDFEDSSMERIKLIDLGVQIRSHSLALLVGLKPEADNKVGIRVQLRPSLGENNLPPNVKLTLLSSSGEKKQEIESRTQDNYIQLKRWKSKPGTRFSLTITLNDLSLTEDFLV
ncbi:DUF1822 family protein [Anabaena sp. PCC 7108]|uniref:DUF1822 family protein n=1 Tax=Anabaena sp. PCC 7108 TaxID=163908 RepID=UPI0005A8C331|nr:DUF1822 family protein [Anabaena sp. PCC 7108]